MKPQTAILKSGASPSAPSLGPDWRRELSQAIARLQFKFPLVLRGYVSNPDSPPEVAAKIAGESLILGIYHGLNLDIHIPRLKNPEVEHHDRLRRRIATLIALEERISTRITVERYEEELRKPPVSSLVAGDCVKVFETIKDLWSSRGMPTEGLSTPKEKASLQLSSLLNLIFKATEIHPVL
jgi:hypothetical protein